MKKISLIIATAALALCAFALCACSGSSQGGGSSNNGGSRQGDTTQTIGNEDVGYIEIPSDWMEFEDVDVSDENIVQYISADQDAIITMDLYDISQFDDDSYSSASEQAANNIYASVLDDGVDEDDVEGAQVTLGNIDAYQVYCYYESDNSFLVVWLFEDDDHVHYIAAEGSDSIMDAVGYVEDTYTPGK